MTPAPPGRPVALAGMSYTTQCHQPLPVGASKSKTVTAKLRVPAGTSFHSSTGERFSPSQPKPLYSCALVIRWLVFISGSGLVSSNARALPANIAAKAKPNARFIRCLLLRLRLVILASTEHDGLVAAHQHAVF